MMQSSLVAYFSMEIGLESGMPTYAGGLGVLAGDTIRSAADLVVPMVAVSLLHRRGYFFQRLDTQGRQSEDPVAWPVNDFAELIDERATVDIEGRTVHVRAWRYRVTGESGHVVPVYLLDTDVSENQPWDRTLTDVLYGGDDRYRLCQEVVLGIGGLHLLRALGYQDHLRFHMNEGHAALLVLALMEEKLAVQGQAESVSADLIENVREQCVFTTHTPVPAGHDQFPEELARRVLGDRRCGLLKACGNGKTLNLTLLALQGSRYINGVAMKHGEVSHSMFPGYPIHSITNGVHSVTWTAPSFQKLFDTHLPDWRRDQLSLRYAVSIPLADIWAAHVEAKRSFVEHVNAVPSRAATTSSATEGLRCLHRIRRRVGCQALPRHRSEVPRRPLGQSPRTALTGPGRPSRLRGFRLDSRGSRSNRDAPPSWFSTTCWSSHERARSARQGRFVVLYPATNTAVEQHVAIYRRHLVAADATFQDLTLEVSSLVCAPSSMTSGLTSSIVDTSTFPAIDRLDWNDG